MNLVLISPEICVLATAVVIILADLFFQRKSLLSIISLVGLAVAFGFTVYLWGGNTQTMFNNMLVVDKFALFFNLLFTVMAALVILASTDYVSKFDSFQGEYYARYCYPLWDDADFRGSRLNIDLCRAGINQHFTLCTGRLFERC